MAVLTPEQMREYAQTVANTYQTGVNPQEIVDQLTRDLQSVSETPEQAMRNLDIFEQQIQDIQSAYTSLAGFTPENFAEFTTNIGRAAGFDRAPVPPTMPTTPPVVEPPPVAPPSVDFSGLTEEQQAFAQTRPTDLQDDYVAATLAGLGDETSGATLQGIAELLKGRGLSFDEAAQATGLTADDPNYQAAVRAYYGLAPTATDLTPGGMQQFSYTDFPGGIYGPGQQMPNIFVPQQSGAPAPAATPGAAPPAAPGPRTMVSPGITTYAYPQPFGNIDIFGRPNATAPTAYTPPPANNTNNTGS